MKYTSFLLFILLAPMALACGEEKERQSSVGGQACTNDQECLDDCEEALSAPVQKFTLPFEASECRANGSDNGTISNNECICFDRLSNELVVSPELDGNCYVGARNRTCLFSKSDYQGCSVSGPECADLCSRLGGMIEEEKSKAYAAIVRMARCNVPSSCECVLNIDNRCFANFSYTTYDCALSDEEILRQYGASQ